MIDKRKTENLIYELLLALGENPEREGLKDTPMRVSNMLCEIFEKDEKETESFKKVFKEDFISDGYVQVRDIPFYSFCEHHMLPFFGKVHLGYVPRGKVFGVSKLARLVDVFARRLQIQERMTRQIAAQIMESIMPEGVGVVVEAQHLCMLMRGVEKQNSVMKTSCMLGSFRREEATRLEFLNLIKG